MQQKNMYCASSPYNSEGTPTPRAHWPVCCRAPYRGLLYRSTAEHTPLATVEDRAKVKARLGRQLRLSKHRALTLWFVGNEMNGPWQGFVCEPAYADKYLDFLIKGVESKEKSAKQMFLSAMLQVSASPTLSERGADVFKTLSDIATEADKKTLSVSSSAPSNSFIGKL